MFSQRLSSMLKSPFAKRFILVSFLAFFLFLFWPQAGWAQDASNRFGLDAAASIGLAQGDLKVTIVRIIQILLGFLGIMAVIMILYGGFIWMTSGGDPEKIGKAKKILINTIIGLIIILSSYIITAFIINAFLGAGGARSGGRACPGCTGDLGRWGIGAGPISSVYPEPGQTDVPINTWIAVTFKEDVDPTTICNDANSDGRCANEVMTNVEICKLDDDNLCETDTDFKVADFATTRVTNLTTDKKTFVFTTNKYLGLEDFQQRRFQVLLTGGIKRLADGQPILDVLFNNQYYWSFVTNGELDLDPPEIVSTNAVLNPPGINDISGVYPNPDLAKDTYGQVGSPMTKKYTVSVVNNNISRKVNSSYTQPVAGSGTTATANLTGTYGGSADGLVTVAMDSGAETVNTNWPSGIDDYNRAYSSGQVLDIGPYGLVFNLNSNPNPGNSWTFNVVASRVGDRLEILENSTVKETYIFGSDIAVGDSANETLANIIAKINTASLIFKGCGAGCLETRQSGGAVNRFILRSLIGSSSQANDKITMTQAQAGADPTPTRVVNGGQRDVPKNSIFQINFNEAINPVYIDNLIVKRGGEVLSADSYVVEVSNQYKTIELRGPDECGVNNCGEKMFCWPVDSEANNYEVSVGSAALITADDSRCAQWGGTAEGGSNNRCLKTIDGKTVPYPAVATPVTGFVDMSGNSFNGSFNYYSNGGQIIGIANGPKSVYSLNASSPLYSPSDPENAGFGDNFKWSFWVANEVDLQAPLIKQLDTLGNNMKGGNQTLKLIEPVEVVFDRLMRSSTLKPGWNYGEKNNDKARSLRYLILETLTANRNPVGYWINKIEEDENNDTLPDYTASYINHNIFDYPVSYGPLAGSGLQSITQNCFLPAGGPKNAGAGDCRYNSGSDITSDCVRDEALGDSQVKTPNPASYGYLNCSEVTGATVCPAETNNCQVLYYNEADATTDLGGSWIITRDYNTATDGATGCCFGTCVPK